MRIRSFPPLAHMVAVTAVTAAVALAVPAAASAATAPGQPTNLVATAVTETSVSLAWNPPTGPAATRYTVSMWVADYIQQVAASTTPTAVVGGLRRGTTYRFAVTAFDAAGGSSPGSAWLKVTTAPGDAIPPTPPGQPVASEVTTTSVKLRWGFSSDANAVDRYLVYRVDGTTLTQVATSPGHPPSLMAVVTGLTPQTTYRFVVRAEDPIPNLSAPSSTVEVTTLAVGPTTPPPTTPTTPAVSCAVAYQVHGQWGGGTGFQASVTVMNTGPVAIPDWTLRWTFPSGQRVVNLWNGTATQDLAEVTVVPLDWNRVIPAGGSRQVAFIGASPSGNASPVVFSVNGAACALS